MSSQESFHTPNSTIPNSTVPVDNAHMDTMPMNNAHMDTMPMNTPTPVSDSASSSGAPSPLLQFTAGPALSGSESESESESDTDSDGDGDIPVTLPATRRVLRSGAAVARGMPPAHSGTASHARGAPGGAPLALHSFDLGGSFDPSLAAKLHTLRDVQSHASPDTSPTKPRSSLSDERRTQAAQQLRRDTSSAGWRLLNSRPAALEQRVAFRVSRRYRDFRGGDSPMPLTDDCVDLYDSCAMRMPVPLQWRTMIRDMSRDTSTSTCHAFLRFVLSGRAVSCPQLPPSVIARAARALFHGQVSPLQGALDRMLSALEKHKWAMWYRAVSQLPGVVTAPVGHAYTEQCEAFDALVASGQWEEMLYYTQVVVLRGCARGVRGTLRIGCTRGRRVPRTRWRWGWRGGW